MPFLEESYDIAVVGAGHAGCEAALAAARLGFETIMFTVSVDSIALMPCNPNIGGSSKGHLVTPGAMPCMRPSIRRWRRSWYSPPSSLCTRWM